QAGGVNLTVGPSPASNSAQILHPCTSTHFLANASPIHVPACSDRECRRWDASQTGDRYAPRMPLPPSFTAIIPPSSVYTPDICTTGLTPGLAYLMALSMRLANNNVNSCSSQTISGRAPQSMAAESGALDVLATAFSTMRFNGTV